MASIFLGGKSAKQEPDVLDGGYAEYCISWDTSGTSIGRRGLEKDRNGAQLPEHRRMNYTYIKKLK
jgi:hypothetical protein